METTNKTTKENLIEKAQFHLQVTNIKKGE